MTYELADIKAGNWIIVGNGRHAVGWNSALDHDWNRQISHRIYEVKAVTAKSVVPVQAAWHRDRFEVDQIIAVFDSADRAKEVLAEGIAHWKSYEAEIHELSVQLQRLRTDRFITTCSRIRAKTNR